MYLCLNIFIVLLSIGFDLSYSDLFIFVPFYFILLFSLCLGCLFVR